VKPTLRTRLDAASVVAADVLGANETPEPESRIFSTYDGSVESLTDTYSGDAPTRIFFALLNAIVIPPVF
jgi:hypothetical protein